MTCCAYLPGLNDSHDDAKGRHCKYSECIVHVVICEPEAEGEELEHVEGVKHLEEQQSHDAVDGDNNFIGTVHQAAQGLLLVRETALCVQLSRAHVTVQTAQL